MSLLTKPEDLVQGQTFKGLIYGPPGIGKSTLALSSPNPVMFDFDRGMKRVQPQFRVPSLQVENYGQVLELIKSPDVNAFDTLVCDTLGKLIDRICDYTAEQNPKTRQADGQMSMKGWGAVKGNFQAFLKLLEGRNKSIMFVAHESEEKDGDNTKKRPDCSGSARKDIIKELDFMGYMEMVGDRRTISFSPTEKYYAKNSLGLVGNIEVPDTAAHGNTFVTKYIVKMTEERIKQQAEMRSQYNTLINLIDANISGLSALDEVNDYYSEMANKKTIWDSAYYEKRKLADKVKELDFEFDRQAKTFKAKGGQNVSDNADAA
jgi:hypothetical protein